MIWEKCQKQRIKQNPSLNVWGLKMKEKVRSSVTSGASGCFLINGLWKSKPNLAISFSSASCAAWSIISSVDLFSPLSILLSDFLKCNFFFKNLKVFYFLIFLVQKVEKSKLKHCRASFHNDSRFSTKIFFTLKNSKTPSFILSLFSVQNYATEV